MAAAVAFLGGDDSRLEVTDIRGIWVASDEAEAVGIIKEIAPSYLPNVDNTTVLSVSGGVEGGPKANQTATRTGREVSNKHERCREEGGKVGEVGVHRAIDVETKKKVEKTKKQKTTLIVLFRKAVVLVKAQTLLLTAVVIS